MGVEILRIRPTHLHNFSLGSRVFCALCDPSTGATARRSGCLSLSQLPVFFPLLTLLFCCINLVHATWWQRWDVCFLFFWSFIPTANNCRPPRPTKKGDPGPVGLKTHAKDSESEKGIGGAGSRRGATL